MEEIEDVVIELKFLFDKKKGLFSLLSVLCKIFWILDILFRLPLFDQALTHNLKESDFIPFIVLLKYFIIFSIALELVVSKL
jgi:hypothetical protein